MQLNMVLAIIVILLLSGCSQKSVNKAVVIDPPGNHVDYLKEIKPLLDKRCTVCHSCYNSPCQLKLSSYDGLDRGATKKEVYDSKRLWSMEPTRLFVDAKSTEEWREKGFHSVTQNSAASGENNSILLKMLHQKKVGPRSNCSDTVTSDCSSSFKPEEDSLTCGATGTEIDSYLEKHPNRGMPYGFPPLKKQEFELIRDWLTLGGKGPTEKEQELRSSIAPEDLEHVKKWEEFLNQQDARHMMTARYLYEHLFLAHISFSSDSKNFYELVRSRTAPGKEIDIIATVRPYDDPGTSRFYYRFRRIYSTIVHKTHMVFELDDHKLDHYNDLFINSKWVQKPTWIGFDKRRAANPFAVFEQIPPKARYRFLLENSHYIIMTFIRGPVCKGQVALNVVRDHFWLLFMDPEFDLAAQHPGFLHDNLNFTRIPTEQGSFFSLFKSFMIPWYESLASDYVQSRQRYYENHYGYRGLDHNAIWAGEKATDSPVLTVFRHFNSASVHKGALGDLPRTIWVMDYPLLERIYYALVAGFDVYGSVGHQLSVRLYMDNLRQEGETFFLDFLPRSTRRPMMKDWYGGISLEKIDYQPSRMEAGYPFLSDEPKREFIEYLVDHHFNPEIGIHFDENYRRAGERYPELPEQYGTEDDYIRGFHAASAPGTSFFKYVNDHNANVAPVRIRINDSRSEVVSMVIHRWHDDVRTMSKEDEKLNQEKDKADFILGYVGSYPNYFFDVHLEDLPDFLLMLKEYDGGNEAVRKLLKYGVNRADDDFWEHYDWFQSDFLESDPLRAGLFDLNRYYHLAIDENDLIKGAP